jgi:hypothetical protein
MDEFEMPAIYKMVNKPLSHLCSLLLHYAKKSCNIIIVLQTINLRVSYISASDADSTTNLPWISTLNADLLEKNYILSFLGLNY